MADGPTPELWATLRTRRPVSDDALTTIDLSAGADATPLAIAMDQGGNLHLLIPVDQGPIEPNPPDLNGLKVRHRRLESGEVLDLVANPSHETVFNAVCKEVVEAIVDSKREPWSAVAAIIRKWQSAWKPARQEMDKSVQVGLFGELVVLESLLIPSLGAGAIEQWSGPELERHDFVGDILHIEVKTTRKSRHEHEISRLDQLRVPQGRRLLVVSILLEQSVGGSETVATRMDAIVNLLRSDAAAMDSFMTKMVNMGWAEQMRDSGELLRFFLRDAAVYAVDEEFPRLSDDFFPPSGVVSVKYTVDLANLPALGMEEVAKIVRDANPHCLAGFGYA